ncbi:MAG: alpha/beta hydrolase family protein [Pseudonocardiaceae bacterium]
MQTEIPTPHPWQRLFRTVDPAPAQGAWAITSTRTYPPLTEHHPATVQWRHLRIDPGLVGLAPSRGHATELRIGYQHHPQLWTVPVSGVVSGRLAWHPHRPRVAGLLVRDRTAHPWVADFVARTVTVYDQVPAATSLSALDPDRNLPLAWHGHTHLVLLAPPPTLDEDPDDGPLAAVWEAIGPHYVEFTAAFDELARSTAAAVAMLDLEKRTVRAISAALLVRSITASPDGDHLLIKHAVDDASSVTTTVDRDGLRWASSVLNLTESPPSTTSTEPTARWAHGHGSLLASAAAHQDDTRIRLATRAGEHTLAIGPTGSRDLVSWWAGQHLGRPIVVSHHRGVLTSTLRLTTVGERRSMPLPAEVVRMDNPAVHAATDGGAGRFVLTCVAGDGRVGIAILDLVAVAITIAWASDRGQDRSTTLTAVDRGDTLELWMHSAQALRRYGLCGDRLELLGAAISTTLRPKDTPSTGVVRNVTLGAASIVGAGLTVVTNPNVSDNTGPLLLWLCPYHADETRPAIPPIGGSTTPLTLTVTGFPVAAMDLPLSWSPDATLDALHTQIVTTIQSAVDTLAAHFPQDYNGSILIGGHSFGATLALYVLAHLPWFAGAIVHSGSYNRTMTPTGFQYEHRPYWAAPDIYHAFSAVLFADRLTAPVLIVHGAEDTNPATTPEQAVALYRSIIATGGHARLVLLPHEGHKFNYHESQEILVVEHRAWLRRWAGPQSPSVMIGRIS